jgi:hypothetical protein
MAKSSRNITLKNRRKNIKTRRRRCKRVGGIFNIPVPVTLGISTYLRELNDYEKDYIRNKLPDEEKKDFDEYSHLCKAEVYKNNKVVKNFILPPNLHIIKQNKEKTVSNKIEPTITDEYGNTHENMAAYLIFKEKEQKKYKERNTYETTYNPDK